MRQLILCVLFILGLFPVSAISDPLWKWDNDRATNVLIPDRNCNCYYSFSFSEKVIPQAESHFILGESQSQIVTSQLNMFMADVNDVNDIENVLRAHMKYEFNHLEKLVGKDKLTLVKSVYDSGSKSINWIFERTLKNGSSFLVSTATVSDECVVYVSSLIEKMSDANKITTSQMKIMKSLNIHHPSSKEEAEKLLSNYIQD